jgi:hypothetical protein
LSRCVSILCLVAWTTSASAQPEQPAKSTKSAHDQAETLFHQGKKLLEQKKLAEACAAFEDSQRLEPSISTLLNLANCREKNNQFATAWQLFTDAERQTHGRPDQTSKQLNNVAVEHAAKLEARSSKLSIDVPPARQLAGLEVLRGVDRVDPDSWNRPVPIDGGTYKITARAPGHAEWSTTVVIKPERDVQTIAIPKLKPAPPLYPDPAASRHDSPDKHPLLLPIAMGGATLVLGGTALAFSRWGDSIYADAEREPDDARQESLWRSANKRRYAAIGFSAGAVACTGAAIYLYLRGVPEAQPVARRSLRIEPTASASSMGLGVRGVW